MPLLSPWAPLESPHRAHSLGGHGRVEGLGAQGAGALLHPLAEIPTGVTGEVWLLSPAQCHRWGKTGRACAHPQPLDPAQGQLGTTDTW